MWIVRLALRNPYSVAVVAIVIMMMGALSLATILTDIFPIIDLPVVAVVWSFPGLAPEEVESRIVTVNERALSTTVSGITRIESQSLPGIANLRVYFEPGTEMGTAIAQISASCSTILRILPPGITPPNVFPFNASNVPVAQLTLKSEKLDEGELFDYAANFVRMQLFTVPGLATPAPYGGYQKEVVVDVDPSRAQSKGISPQDVVSSISNQNLIIPAGDSRIGKYDFSVRTNSSPTDVKEFGNFPIKMVNQRPVLLKEVSDVSFSHADQTNIVRIDGKRATYLNILKKSDASTLKVVQAVKDKIPAIKADGPKGLEAKIDFDQSVFVRSAVNGVVREGFIAAALVSLMILFFLGSWRSVFIVCTSIPLSILVGIIGIKLTGGTINIMTLGGLSLAIGMLVDDATVEIENINRNIPLSSSVTVAILRGASQIALPAIVSTLAICIVFSPIALLTGPAKFLFTPMAEAVVLSMLASYVLSRTLVPVLARMLLENAEKKEKKGGVFEKVKTHYGNFLKTVLDHRGFILASFGVVLAISLALPFFVIGTDFFPTTDAGIMKLHFRAPTGLRIEETEKVVQEVEDHIRKIIPQNELMTINSNIGVPTSYNLAFVPSDNVGMMDAEILVALNKGHQPTDSYVKMIRKDLEDNFPGSVAYFQSADIVNQVLNFGITSPIDVQIKGKNTYAAFDLARKLRDRMRTIPGAADVVIKQTFDYPTLTFQVDRLRAAEVGLTEHDIANNLLIGLSSSFATSPSFYIDPKSNVQYTVAVKFPIIKIDSVSDLSTAPVMPSGNALVQNVRADLLTEDADTVESPTATIGNFAAIETSTTMSQINHDNIERVLDITASVDGRDLGGVVGDIEKEIKKLGQLPEGLKIKIAGQSEVMHESFTKLGLGMILAIALVYLLMVILFQSWLDPFIIMAVVPGTLIGVLWGLAATHTTLNVPSLMGTIMAIGIAVSNSNLLVNFANDVRVEKNLSPMDAAFEAATVRLRPVLMTAAAMILGMLPLSLGLGEGGEQNAPLGRAVIGGLIVATLSTLIIVPIVYSLLRTELPTKFILQKKFKKEEERFDEEESHAAQNTSKAASTA
jgi:multidrug efflux pump subunit AcrB